MFMYVNVDPKLWRQYAETWIFGMFSCCVRQGKYLGNCCHLSCDLNDRDASALIHFGGNYTWVMTRHLCLPWHGTRHEWFNHDREYHSVQHYFGFPLVVTKFLTFKPPLYSPSKHKISNILITRTHLNPDNQDTSKLGSCYMGPSTHLFSEFSEHFFE